jgi:ComF family protein
MATAAEQGPALARLWALLFPARCLGCGRRGAPICARCREAIPWLGAEVCPRCARASALGRLCARRSGNPGALDGIRAACAFEGIVRQAIHHLKYRHARSLASFAADLLERSLSRRPLRADLIVPVPLSRARRRERGYNQAELIADRLTEAIGLPTDATALERVRETPPQVGLSAAERRHNVRGAFACDGSADLTGRRVILIDDVATTGSTLQACADPLKAAGAARVFGLVVARD